MQLKFPGIEKEHKGQNAQACIGPSASSSTGLGPMQFNFLSKESAAPDNDASLQTSNALEQRISTFLALRANAIQVLCRPRGQMATDWASLICYR
ncbi:hypothetical protein GJ744_006633 [Endocarpon pusillum]|uniref:Uncharacterized protein n=1 Tax=Endocarpon pusillum TaxID=364733 RepID=A0A8H7ATD6_9EURO|nr:hypothetical protein GJ744_006633 [Endocarpon pusillum]